MQGGVNTLMAGMNHARKERASYSRAGYVGAYHAQEERELYIAKAPAGSLQDDLKDYNRIGYRSERPWNETPEPLFETKKAQPPKYKAAPAKQKKRTFAQWVIYQARQDRMGAMVCTGLLCAMLMMVVVWGGEMVQGVQLNEAGANALAQWMMTTDTQALIENVGLREFGEPIFSLPTDNLLFAGKIAAATPASKTIRLAVESTILDSGLTDELLPTFQQAYQYEVTVTQGPAAAVLNAARSGYADLILLEAGDPVTALVTEGFARTVPGLMGEQLRICSMQYLLCGPREDPAKVADRASVGESFAAIAAGEFRFTCPGDGSPAHRLAHQFWPASTQFGSWYVDADMAMGPSLVMSDIEGGYILTDKLTWLIFSQADGII